MFRTIFQRSSRREKEVLPPVIRVAKTNDIKQMHKVRLAVLENKLSNPDRITPAMYGKYLVDRGRGWVCESGEDVIGFAVADLENHNLWALFVLPAFEKKGIGRKLHETLLNWYFSQTSETLWLSTAPGTRAEKFYRTAGWNEAGLYENTELKFEMTTGQWQQLTLKEA